MDLHDTLESVYVNVETIPYSKFVEEVLGDPRVTSDPVLNLNDARRFRMWLVPPT